METKKEKNIIKIEPYTKIWEREANSLARSFVPDIKACRHCGHPVISGYCCGVCASTTP